MDEIFDNFINEVIDETLRDEVSAIKNEEPKETERQTRTKAKFYAFVVQGSSFWAVIETNTEKELKTEIEKLPIDCRVVHIIRGHDKKFKTSTRVEITFE